MRVAEDAYGGSRRRGGLIFRTFVLLKDRPATGFRE